MSQDGIKRRGFGSMSPERKKELATLGGKSNPNRHRFTSEEAKAAQEKGLLKRRQKGAAS